jgi:hypothetical protein
MPKAARVREEDDLYVIDLLLSHTRAGEDLCWLICDRFTAYRAEDNKPEPAMELPDELVRSFEHQEAFGLIFDSS